MKQHDGYKDRWRNMADTRTDEAAWLRMIGFEIKWGYTRNRYMWGSVWQVYAHHVTGMIGMPQLHLVTYIGIDRVVIGLPGMP